MAASISIEEEQGTCVASPHPHNGYYAGDFTGVTALAGALRTVARTPRDDALSSSPLARARSFPA
jgi:hypothetical protein